MWSKLAWIQSMVKMSNGINLYDINIHAETFFCKLLNLIFGYDLINLNNLSKNFSSIDLGDRTSKVAVQVTSDNSSTKIHTTIDGFISNKYYEDYERLIIFILGDKKKYTITVNTFGMFDFSIAKDVYDICDLIKRIGTLETLELEKISSFLDDEITGLSLKVNTSSKGELVKNMRQRAAALCKVKLKASGIPAKIASQIIVQDIESTKFEYIIHAAERGRTYLVGEFGSGKSHAILILAQRLMRDYLSGNYHRIPLFVQAYEILEHTSIQNWVEQNTGQDNFIAFIDGLDEIEYPAAQKIVNEIDFLKELWTDSLFIVGSRPMTVIPATDVRIRIEAMSYDEKCQLFATVSGLDQSFAESEFLHLDPKLDNLLSRPFFCIIYALFKVEPRSWAKTDMDLVTAFITKSVEKLKGNGNEVLSQLEQLAVLSVNKNLGRVHRSELDDNINIEILLKTGFITPSDAEYYSFPLPIVTQWLAAEAIRHKIISIKDIICNEDAISRWRYSLSILFSQMSFRESQNIFSTIVHRAPGIASIIIKDGIRFGESNELPSAFECGQMLRFCMKTWISALGPLSQYIAPMGKNGLYNLAIDVSNSRLTTTWADRPDEEDIVVMPFDRQKQWFTRTVSRGVPMQATWPWIVTFRHLSGRLEEVVKSHSLLIESELLESEHLWNTSRILAGKGSLYEKGIDLSSVERYRKYIGKKYNHNGHDIQCDLYFSLIDKLLSKDIFVIQPPYPVSDKSFSTSNSVWSTFSNQRMLEYARFIYSGAINEYKHLVDVYFCKLANRMPMYSLYPAKFIGYLKYDDTLHGLSGAPIMTWYLFALPEGQAPEYIFFFNANYDKAMDHIQELQQNNIKYRPCKRDWITSSIHQQPVYMSPTPVTDIVYDWLKDDLKAIGWIK
ncbi:MAG: SMEK domain-containing protein [Anaerotignum propionicum]|uniref:SMEK domain-containing protein n=1 Tax=Anaerotignum propionicum TaxID=28446 RepID=UPI002B217F9C|nr:SMEK domain-containing protein [Anaerotignum propionicum]MEA5057940.1 SMEK domain-containing protein [Anaerotignum propionicum]